jgi:glutamine synthetase
MLPPSPKAKRIEVRFLTRPRIPTRLCCHAHGRAGRIYNKINPGEPAEKDLADLEAKEAAKIRTMPGAWMKR